MEDDDEFFCEQARLLIGNRKLEDAFLFWSSFRSRNKFSKAYQKTIRGKRYAKKYHREERRRKKASEFSGMETQKRTGKKFLARLD